MTPKRTQINLNPMTLNSINAFFSINGRFANSCKACYFLRYIGYDDKNAYINELIEGENQFMKSAINRNIGYARFHKLAFAPSPDEAVFYEQIFQSIISSAGENQSNSKLCELFSFDNVDMDAHLFEGVSYILEIFRRTSPHCSDSMVKNFTVKTLHWIKIYFPEIFPTGYTLATSSKVVFTGAVKVQEYLFLYLLTYLGCDVLFLDSNDDIDLPANLLELSVCCKCKNVGIVEIPKWNGKQNMKENDDVNSSVYHEPAYNQNNTENNSQSSAESIISPSPSKSNSDEWESSESFTLPGSYTPKSSSSCQINVPPHPKRTNSNMVLGTNPNNSASNSTGALSYEQIALMASSVVMIEVADKDGNCFKSGSGVMIGKSGYILTNFHVINQGVFFGVKIEDDDQIYETTDVIKYHNVFDLAVLRIDKDLSPIKICKSDKLTRGQKVVAIGSPMGLFNTVSDGIISAFRDVQGVPMIQFTAPISSGSSGGAVLNMKGELIGLSTAGINDGQNLNLAVDYKTINNFLGNLKY